MARVFNAIGEMADHPKGACRAECGFMLLAVAVLWDAVCHAGHDPLTISGGRCRVSRSAPTAARKRPTGAALWSPVTVTTSTMLLATAPPRGSVSDE